MKTDSSSENAAHRMEQMVSKLREREFRITPQRMAVLRVLAAIEGHHSVKEIYEIVRREFPTTGIATIYKTVNLLKKLNEVLEIAIPGGGKWYDGHKPFPHPHVICIGCKKVIDLDIGSLKDITKKVADKTGFDIMSYRLDFFGVCSDCEKKRKTG
ncbi:MAG: transcriptional repressor [Desulfobacterales bacterium]